jgi:hypothetical protein
VRYLAIKKIHKLYSEFWNVSVNALSEELLKKTLAGISFFHPGAVIF